MCPNWPKTRHLHNDQLLQLTSSLLMNFEEKNHNSVGPWGGQNGAKWDDGVHSGIRQVVICYGASIESIQIEYDRKGSSVWSEKHGGTGGLRTNKIKLEYPEECLVSVSGHYGSIVEYGQVLVRSLSFESNRRKYGPFGIQHGTHFALPTNGGKVVGFHGRSSWHLDSIGVHLKPLLPKIHKTPTYVGEKNKAAGFFEEEKYNNVIYVQCGGSSGDRYKGYGDPEFEMLNNTMVTPWTSDILRAPVIDPWKEFSSGILGVNGGAIFEYDVNKTSNEIQQVNISPKDTIEAPPSSTWKSGPFGFGRWRGNGAATLDAEAENKSKPDATSTPPQAKDIIGAPTASPRNAVSSQGPWGGSGGVVYNDGIYTGVREVHITRHGGLVSIRVCYDSDGQAIWGNRNGESDGIRLDKIAFDYPAEILTQISGYYGPTISRGPTVVKSLTFHTNKRKYGPFGDEQGGAPFSSASDKARIVGFHGRKGRFIDSIGVHVIEESMSPAPTPLWRRPNSYEASPVMEIAPNPPFRTSHESFNKTSPKVYELSPTATKDVVPNPPLRIPNPPLRTSHDFTKTSPKAYEVPPVTMKEIAPPSKCGPWGGNGGKPWDDGVYGGVRSIYLTKGEAIYCIHIEYDRNGQFVWSPRHGSGGDRTSHLIKLDYPNEVLTGISGHYDSLSGDDTNFVIKSLTFITNKGKRGPYGKESGTSFSTKAQGKIVGFHGRSACFLNNIGVHVQP